MLTKVTNQKWGAFCIPPAEGGLESLSPSGNELLKKLSFFLFSDITMYNESMSCYQNQDMFKWGGSEPC